MTPSPSSKSIVIVLADDDHEDREDIARSYDAGANSYVRKPVTFEGLVHAIRALGRYWLAIVELLRDAPPE